MATKELGYVELEWTCPRCNTRNPGTQTTCSGCGAPQPADVKFEAPVGGELLKDKEKIGRAKSGPDIQCAYCGARNPATAKTCHQCGADLTEGKAREAGQVVGAFQSGSAPQVKCSTCGTLNAAGALVCRNCGASLPRPQPVAVPAPAAASAGGSRWIWVVVGLVVAGIVLFAFLSLRTKETVGTVQATRWVRTIPLQALVPVEHQDWQDELPQDARVLSCQQEVRRVQDSPAANAVEVCGTPYTVDTGTGIGQVRQDCQYEVYDDRCSYTVDEWRVVDMLESSGTDFSPAWPTAALQPRQRLGQGTERLQCVLNSDGQSFTYEPRSFDEYLQCQPGSRWRLHVNGLGALTAAEPTQ
jgi:ribosomal protein L40E